MCVNCIEGSSYRYHVSNSYPTKRYKVTLDRKGDSHTQSKSANCSLRPSFSRVNILVYCIIKRCHHFLK